MPRSTVTDDYEIIDSTDLAVSDEKLQQIRTWLQPTDYLAESSEFRRHLLARTPGTGLWITQTEEYKTWLRSADTGSLWIKGVPGAGKSVIAASLVQHLKTTEQVPVLFFFFRNIVAANFSPNALIRDWLAQLLPFSGKLQFLLEPWIGTALQDVSDNELIGVLTEGLASVPRVYCVADALDEMAQDHRVFLDKLNGLATFKPRSVKLLLTSRPSRYLQRALRSSSIVQIALERTLVDPEIEAWLTHRLQQVLASLPEDAEFQRTVIDSIVKRSGGLFLYAKLSFDRIEHLLLSSRHDTSHLLESIPVGLAAMYTQALALQRNTYGITLELQILVLQAIICAPRPLRLNEVACLVRHRMPHATAPTQFKQLIVLSCSPLIEVLEDETLQIIHHSLTEFLRGDTDPESEMREFPVIELKVAHCEMALSCISYLRSGALLPASGYRDSNEGTKHALEITFGIGAVDSFDYRQAKLKYPFLSYAVENWAIHASRCDLLDRRLTHALSEFDMNHRRELWRWIMVEWRLNIIAKADALAVPSNLHIAALCGLSAWAAQLCSGNHYDSNALDCYDRTPLHWAAEREHTAVVQILLTHGADPNIADVQDSRPLHLAARRNHATIITLLLEAGAEVDAIKTKGNDDGPMIGYNVSKIEESAIFYVTKHGHYDSAMAMLPYLHGDVLEQLLCESCRYNRTDITLAVLQNSDVRGNASYRDATALGWASWHANVVCIKALLSKGADVHAFTTYVPRELRRYRRNKMSPLSLPLHALVSNWSAERSSDSNAALKLLVNAGADLDASNSEGDTPLLVASGTHWGQITQSKAIQTLLEAGADPNKPGCDGEIALIRACRFSTERHVISLLMEHKSEVNFRGPDGRTALFHLFGREQAIDDKDLAIKSLLEHGADTTIVSDTGETPMEVAIRSSDEIPKILLPYCVSDEAKSKAWFSISGIYGIRDVQKALMTSAVDLFLEHGMDIERRDKDGRTLFLSSLDKQHLPKILHERGASMTVVDSSGCNALHFICQKLLWTSHCVPLLEKYIEYGNDISATDGLGNSLLHHAAPSFRDSEVQRNVVRFLLHRGIPVNARNKAGQTALHIYLQQGPSVSQDLPGLLSLLEEHTSGLDLNLGDASGLTLLHFAAVQSTEVVKALVEAGADPTISDTNSQSPLHLACRARMSATVGYLLQQIPKDFIDSTDLYSRTPLHLACRSGQLDSVMALLDAGADPLARADNNQTTLHFAAEAVVEEQRWSFNGPDAMHKRSIFIDEQYRLDDAPRSYDSSWYCSLWPSYKKPYNANAAYSITKALLRANIDIRADMKPGYPSAVITAAMTGCVGFLRAIADDVELFKTASEIYDESYKWVATGLSLQSRLSFLERGTLAREPDEAQVIQDLIRQPRQNLCSLSWNDINDIAGRIVVNQKPIRAYAFLEAFIAEGSIAEVSQLPHVRRLIKQCDQEASLRRLLVEDRDDELIQNWKPAAPLLHRICARNVSSSWILRYVLQLCTLDVNARALIILRAEPSDDRDIAHGGTALHVCADANHWWQLEAMKSLIASGANLDAQDESGRTPLHIAAKGFRKESMEVYAFHSCCGSWRSEAVEILIKAGADVNALDHKGLSPLYHATDSPTIMLRLLESGADPHIGKASALFHAIADQNDQALEILLDHGVNPNSVNVVQTFYHDKLKADQTRYALLCAALSPMNGPSAGSVRLVRTLINRGADLYLPISSDETLIHRILCEADIEVVDALFKPPYIDMIDFNARDQHDVTVLMASCKYDGNYNYFYGPGPRPAGSLNHLVRALNTGRADALLSDDQGRTALHYLLSSLKAPEDVMMELIARPEMTPALAFKDSAGLTPLLCATRILRPVVVEALLDRGASLMDADADGRTVLHYIAAQLMVPLRPTLVGDTTQPDDYTERCLALVEQYCDAGGDINVRDRNGDPPLFRFLLSETAEQRPQFEQNQHDIHRMFPSGQANGKKAVDFRATNLAGETALHIVARRQTSSVPLEHDTSRFKGLMELGLDPLQEDNEGRSALDVANACGKDGIVALLSRK